MDASTMRRLWRTWLEQGNMGRRRGAGAARVTSARVDRRIRRQAVAIPQVACTAILQHVQDTLDVPVSTRTISRRLVERGLHSRRPLRRLPLTAQHRRQRLEWCRNGAMWMTEWRNVVFSDESRFCLSSDSRRIRVWRRRGDRSNPAVTVERPTARERGIMVWGAIAYHSRSPLVRIQGTMTAQRYLENELEKEILGEKSVKTKLVTLERLSIKLNGFDTQILNSEFSSNEQFESEWAKVEEYKEKLDLIRVETNEMEGEQRISLAKAGFKLIDSGAKKESRRDKRYQGEHFMPTATELFSGHNKGTKKE
ncbi:Transposable element Tcb1 transposase, partial [Stegodyphus mimosarum]